MESFQIWKKGFVEAETLQNQEPFRRQAGEVSEVYEVSHPSGVLPETSQFQRRR